MSESPPVHQLQRKLHNLVSTLTGRTTKPLVTRVETMGVEPTTPCLQTMGWTVQERPQPS